jgi:hypothetical protein
MYLISSQGDWFAINHFKKVTCDFKIERKSFDSTVSDNQALLKRALCQLLLHIATLKMSAIRWTNCFNLLDQNRNGTIEPADAVAAARVRVRV